jgi:pyridoxamine 5'-phosphate oxidase
MTDNDELQQIAHLRREYTKGGLRRQDLPAEPLVLFERWLKQACDAKLADPTAMVVATVDENGQPYQRIVLLKHFDEKGWLFVYCSRRCRLIQPARRSKARSTTMAASATRIAP